MKFRELAWGAFILANVERYDPHYGKLAQDEELLSRLTRQPSIDDFQRLRDFLIKYRIRYTPTDFANQLNSIWPSLKPSVEHLRGENLETCDLNNADTCAHITTLYDHLSHDIWGGPTVVSKVLHFFNINLFVMWDNDIRLEYRLQQHSTAYLAFLKIMQGHVTELLADFQHLALPGQPAEFLSHNLAYSYPRPLTKFIGDHNWITITRRWPETPPSWLIKLMA